MNNDILKISQDLESNVKETLSKYDGKIPEEVWNALYDIDADFKHAIDDLAEKLD